MIMINSTDQNRQYECTSKSFYVYSVNKQKLKIPTRALLTYSVPFIQVDATSTQVFCQILKVSQHTVYAL